MFVCESHFMANVHRHPMSAQLWSADLADMFSLRKGNQLGAHGPLTTLKWPYISFCLF